MRTAVHNSRVSLRQIGAHIGLSHSTVSRALRGDPRIPEATQRRVRDACRRLGYRPNSVVNELAAAGWQARETAAGNTIAYVTRTGPQSAIRGEIPPSVARQAALLGYQVEVLHRANFASSAQLQRVLRNRGITEIIFGPVAEKSLTVELDWEKFICVQIMPGFADLPLHSVSKDHFNGLVMAWRKAVGLGYRRIGVTLLDHRVELVDDILRLSAVDACQRHLFPDLPRLPVFKFTANDFRVEAFAQWVKTNRPDAIIGFIDLHPAWLREERNITIPYASLNKGTKTGCSGILDFSVSSGSEVVNLLHFCRRTYQWGLPKQRIDHVIGPIWFEGDTLPPK